MARSPSSCAKVSGFLYFGLPFATDQRSVLYRDILSVTDLDAMGEDY